MAAAKVAGGQVAFGVTTSGAFFTDCKRFLRRFSSDRSFEHAYNFVSLPRCGGLEFSYCHFILSDIAVKVDSLPFTDGDESFLPAVCLAAEKSALGVTGFVFAAHHAGVHVHYLHSVEFLYKFLDLEFVGLGRNAEGIAIELLGEIRGGLGYDWFNCEFQS